MIAAYIGLKQLTGMDKQMMLSLQLSDIREDGIHTQRRKNNALPKIYPWDEGDKLKSAIDDIKKANIPRTIKGKHSKPGSIWSFHNRNGKSYLPMQDGRVFDSEGRAFGKPSGFDSIWQCAMAKWKAAGHEGFTEHDIRKVPASATSTQHAQELLDHQSPEITKRVYQVAPRVVSIDPQNEVNK